MILQLLTIVGSRGNVYVLGEAYAFGVVWSFALKALAVLVLRYTDKSPREWKVPLNAWLGRYELPLGWAISALLFSIAGINLFTKEVATISGVAFTLIFFVVFEVSERINVRRKGAAAHVESDEFQLHPEAEVSSGSLSIRPGGVLCLVRGVNHLEHLVKALE